ncbi:hypothetical protein PTKU15_84360 [Paraburkholderia terrae]|nr:hypothetical protein PTKU15_84360 [Paraburkholderia terrae]
MGGAAFMQRTAVRCGSDGSPPGICDPGLRKAPLGNGGDTIPLKAMLIKPCKRNWL